MQLGTSHDNVQAPENEMSHLYWSCTRELNALFFVSPDFITDIIEVSLHVLIKKNVRLIWSFFYPTVRQSRCDPYTLVANNFFLVYVLNNFLIATIKLCFSRITQLIKQAKIIDDGIEEHDEERESNEEKKEVSDSESKLVEDEGMENQIFDITSVIPVVGSGINVVKYE